ncbi:MAG: hypothetical protein GY711_27925 [bacterium]|nr:hypothetical protein [bacterium]
MFAYRGAPANGLAGDHFGSALAINHSIVVGAPGADAAGVDSGAVYFVGGFSFPTVSQFPTGTAGPGDRFGSSVAYVDRWLAIGAPEHTSGAPGSGTVFVFARDYSSIPAVWALVEELDGSALGLGTALELDGPRLVAAAPQSSAAGEARIFGYLDCNANLVRDDCDIASGTSLDTNGDGLPDECEDIGVRYCSPAVPNSTGAPGRLVASGAPEAQRSFLRLTVTDLPPGAFGYFLGSVSQGSFMPPTSNGILCVVGNVGRFDSLHRIIRGPSDSADIGLSLIDVNPPLAIQAGETWNFQCWYRDVGNTNNFTDAVELLFH